MAQQNPQRDKISDLHQENQSNLIAFLRTDLDTCLTFLEIARSSADHHPSHARTILDNTYRALETVRYFSDRIEDRETRDEIHVRANELEAELRNFPN